MEVISLKKKISMELENKDVYTARQILNRYSGMVVKSVMFSLVWWFVLALMLTLGTSQYPILKYICLFIDVYRVCGCMLDIVLLKTSWLQSIGVYSVPMFTDSLVKFIVEKKAQLC